MRSKHSAAHPCPRPGRCRRDRPHNLGRRCDANCLVDSRLLTYLEGDSMNATPAAYCSRCGKSRECAMHMRAESPPSAARAWLERNCTTPALCELHYRCGICIPLPQHADHQNGPWLPIPAPQVGPWLPMPDLQGAAPWADGPATPGTAPATIAPADPPPADRFRLGDIWRSPRGKYWQVNKVESGTGGIVRLRALHNRHTTQWRGIRDTGRDRANAWERLESAADPVTYP